MFSSFKKFVSAFLAVIMIFCTFTVASAAESDPAEQENAVRFSVKTIIESTDTITIGVYLESGRFSSMELETITSGLRCTEMKKGERLERYLEKEWAETYVSVNPESGRAAFVCSTVYNYIGEFLVMTFEKERSGFSIEVTVPACAMMKDGELFEISPVVEENIISRTLYSRLSDVEMKYKSSTYITPHFVKDDSAGYYTFTSSDPGTVSVDANGRIYAAKKGSAVIKVIYNDPDGPALFDTCTVTVKYSLIQQIIRIFLFGWIWY